METDKYDVIPFVPEHLLVFRPREPLCPYVDVKQNYFRSLAFTGLVNNKPIGCVGIRIFAKIGYVWAFLDSSASDHAVFIHRTTLKFMRNIIKVFGLQRLQAFILPGFSLGQLWVERLGFNYEGTVRCLGPNKEDYKLYSLVVR